MVRRFALWRGEGWVVRHRMVGVCALAIMIASAAWAYKAWADDKTACSPDVIGSATVRAVTDGRTVVLDDGRELRLPGIEVPEDDGNGDAARAVLEKRVG